MTWNEMSHEAKKLKSILTDENDKIIGFTLSGMTYFTLSGMTYDGDGNSQDENGTNMRIVFDSTEKMIAILTKIIKECLENKKWNQKDKKH